MSVEQVENRISQFLDTTGDGTGTENANVDGSSTPVIFKIQPAQGEVFQLNRMLVHIEDSGTFQSDTYGAILAAAISTGVQVQVRLTSDDSVIQDLTNGVPVESNQQWGRFCYDTRLDSYIGGGNDHVHVRWTFERDGAPIILDETMYFCIIINDDFTGLVEHYFRITGDRLRGS